MADTTAEAAAPRTVAPEARKAPLLTAGPLAWARANLFSSWLSGAVTLVLAYLVIRWAVGFVEWAFVKSIWSVPVTAAGADPGLPRPAGRRGLLGRGDGKAPLHPVRHLSL
jgi:general L-amino acid transport system permease protein